VRNWRDFENLYESLRKCGSIKTLKDLWWDIRPSPVFGTLEIRVCDGCATLYETLAIVAFVHTLAHWFTDHGNWLESVNYPPSWLSRENKWRVIRYGLDAELVMNTDGKTRLLREDMLEWLEKLKPYASKLGYNRYLTNLREIMKNGSSSERQRLRFAKTKRLEDVVELNIEELRHGMPRWEKN
jgi:carboxylate-amine ligase